MNPWCPAVHAGGGEMWMAWHKTTAGHETTRGSWKLVISDVHKIAISGYVMM